MIQSELYVLGRLSQIRATLPATAEAEVFRLTFSAFPHHRRQPDELHARPHRALGDGALRSQAALPADPRRRPRRPRRRPDARSTTSSSIPSACRPPGSTLAEVTEALTKNNLVASTGLHEENHTLYLTVVDGRVRSIRDIEDFPVTVAGRHPVRVRDFARVERGPEPVFNDRHRRRPRGRAAQHPQPARRQHARHRQEPDATSWRT